MTKFLVFVLVAVAVLVAVPAWASGAQEVAVSMQPASEALPDLVLWVGMDDQVVVKERMNVEVLVTNAGASLPVSMESVTVLIDFGVGQRTLCLSTPGPGEAVFGKTTLAFLGTHPYEVRVCVDPEHVIQERSIENNEIVQMVDVVEPKKISSGGGRGCPCDG